jgi:hypothetical protein
LIISFFIPFLLKDLTKDLYKSVGKKWDKTKVSGDKKDEKGA